MTATVHVQPQGNLFVNIYIYIHTITHAFEEFGITFQKRAIYIVFSVQLLCVQLYPILRNIHLPSVEHAQLKII